MFVIVFCKSGNKNNTIVLNNFIPGKFIYGIVQINTKYSDLMNLGDLVSLWHCNFE